MFYQVLKSALFAEISKIVRSRKYQENIYNICWQSTGSKSRTGSGCFKEVFHYSVSKNHASWRTFYPEVLLKMPRISQEIIFYAYFGQRTCIAY